MNDHPVIARIRLNPHSRDVQRDLRDATQMHRTVMRMVPDGLGDAPRHQAGLLYRLDETDTSSTLLVQAARLDPAHLPTGYGQADVKSLAPMFTALRKGIGVRYRIVLNPAKRERLSLEEKGTRGRIVPLSGTDADQWWLRRAAEAGLDLHVLTPTSMEPPDPAAEKPPACGTACSVTTVPPPSPTPTLSETPSSTASDVANRTARDCSASHP